MNTRRIFLRNSALAMIGAGSAPLWLKRALYAADAPSPRKKILVAIFQRGAADGLNIAVAFQAALRSGASGDYRCRRFSRPHALAFRRAGLHGVGDPGLERHGRWLDEPGIASQT